MITTLGQIHINENLPEDLQDHNRILTQKELFSLLNKIGNKYPNKYAELTKNLKDLGDLHAYRLGSSLSLEDIKPINVNNIFKKYEGELNNVRKLKNEAERNRKLRDINSKINSDIEDKIKNDLKNPNSLTEWISSGSKGSPDDLKQMTYAMGNVVNMKKEVVPHMAHKSLAEGLSPSDYFIGAIGARKGVAGSFLSVRDPGAFGKELFTLTNDMVTTVIDCGTHKGKTYDIHNHDMVDRCLLEDTANYKRNDIVTPFVQEDLTRQGIKQVAIRTPLGCIAREGVCQKCIGVIENGKLSPIGDSIGLRSAQAITEPLTQLALKEKHTGGMAGKKSAFEVIKQLMHVPESYPGGAVLSRKNGFVQEIEKTADGGKRVYINDHPHYIQPTQDLWIKKGEEVKKGQQITDGLLNPAELVKLVGMEPAREKFAQTLRGVYSDNGVKGHSKLFELIARSVMNFGTVEDPGGHNFSHDDIVRWNQIQPYTEKHLEKLNPLDSIGYQTEHDLPMIGLKQGDKIMMGHAEKLDKLGIKSLDVYKQPMKVKPMMIGTERAAIHKGSWLSNMGFRHVKNRLLDNIAESKATNLHSYDPIPSYISGEFGYGEEGRF